MSIQPAARVTDTEPGAGVVTRAAVTLSQNTDAMPVFAHLFRVATQVEREICKMPHSRTNCQIGFMRKGV